MPLTSTLEQRDQVSTREDFVAAPRVQYLFGDDWSVGNLEAEYLALWNKYVRIKPQLIEKLFDDVCVNGSPVDIVISPANLGFFHLNLRHETSFFIQKYDLGGQFNAHKRRNSCEEDGWVKLPKNVRGSKTGTNAFMRFLELKALLGIHRDRFIAGSELGAYVWSKAGGRLDPKHPQFGFGVEKASIVSRARIEAVRGLLADNDYQTAYNHASYLNDDDNWALADMGNVTVSVDISDFEGGSSIRTEFVSQLERGAMRPDSILAEIANVREIIKSCKRTGRALTLPKFAMAGTEIPLHIDWFDDTQMERISKFGGGFKFFEFSKEPKRRQSFARRVKALVL